MRTYQTLTLIGCILGILLMMGLFGIMGFLTVTQQSLLNSSESFDEQLNTSPETREQTRQQRAEFERQQQESAPFIAGVALSFLIYIALIPIVFVLKGGRQPKIVGIILLVLGVIAIPITNGYGLIPFALLLPAGILALRYKERVTTVEEH